MAARPRIDAVFNYREQSPRKAVAELAPDGVDIYFDNVGGDHLEAAIGALRAHRTRRRVRLDLPLQRCRRRRGRGTCSWWSRSDSVSRDSSSPTTSIASASSREATGWVRDGKLRYRETIVDGIENAPKAFLGLLRGENIGKMLVKVGPAE